MAAVINPLKAIRELQQAFETQTKSETGKIYRQEF